MRDLLPTEGLKKRLITRGFWLYLFGFLILPLGYISRTIVSNDLPVADVGLLYSVIGLMTILAGYNDLGLTGVLKYFLPKYRVEKKYGHITSLISVTYFLQISTGICMSLLFYFGSDRLGEFYFHHEKASQVVRIFSIYFLFFNAFQIITGVASAFQKTLLEKGAHFIQVFVTSLSAVIVFLLFPNSIIHYAWIRVIGLIAAVVVGSIGYYKLFKQFISFPTLNFNIEKSERKEIFNYAGILFLTINVSMLLGQADLQMVTYMMGPKYAGYFANYRVLLVISNALIIPLSTFLFPLVSELYAKKDTQKVKALITVMYKYIPISVMALGFFFIGLGPEIAATLFGVQFTYSGFLLQIAGGFIFLQSLTTINFAVLAGIGKVKSRLWIIITALVFNVIGNYLGIRYFGLPGALCATIFSRTLITILSSYELNKVVKIDWPIKMYVRNFSLFIILASLILLFKESIFSIETNTYRYFNFLLLGVSFLLYGLFIVGFNRNLILKIKDQALQIIRQ